MENWTMPDWMKPYVAIIADGETINYVEEMMNDHSPIQINAPRALIATEVGGRVQMISRLYHKGLLSEYDPDRIC